MAQYVPAPALASPAGAVPHNPDDADVQTRLPSICVDYLSHDWAEEDVWASWRSMTRKKNEIANGVRLENASWRTWWKQRNKLKTISPETLNWCVALHLLSSFLRAFGSRSFWEESATPAEEAGLF